VHFFCECIGSTQEIMETGDMDKVAFVTDELAAHISSLYEAPFELPPLNLTSGLGGPMSAQQREQMQEVHNRLKANASYNAYLMENTLSMTASLKRCFERCHHLSAANHAMKDQIRANARPRKGQVQRGASGYDDKIGAERFRLNDLIKLLEERIHRHTLPSLDIFDSLLVEESPRTCPHASSSGLEWAAENATSSQEADAIESQSLQDDDDQSGSVETDQVDGNGPEAIEAPRRRRRKNINGSERARRRKKKEREARDLAQAAVAAQPPLAPAPAPTVAAVPLTQLQAQALAQSIAARPLQSNWSDA
jgi:hypothetical protein